MVIFHSYGSFPEGNHIRTRLCLAYTPVVLNHWDEPAGWSVVKPARHLEVTPLLHSVPDVSSQANKNPHGTQPWDTGLEHPHVSAWKMMNNCKWAIVVMLHLGVFSAVYINIRSRNQFIVTSIWSVILRWCFCHRFLVLTFLPSFLDIIESLF